MTHTLRRAATAACIAIGALVAMLVVASSSVMAHPIHTSLAEVVHEPASRTVRVSLRVFIDDFTTASLAHGRWVASRQPPGTPAATQSPYVTYALAAFRIADAAGRRLPLASCGGTRRGELMWLCLRGPAPRGLAGLSITNHLMFDLYRDQINIVQASYGGRKTSLLFTRGNGAKRLP